jgi:hypothetical protein
LAASCSIPIGVPGIWFPFNIGVSRTQYVYAIAVPFLALLIVRTFSAESRSISALTFFSTRGARR